MHVTEKKHLKMGKLREKKVDNFGKVWEREGKYARGKTIQVKGNRDIERRNEGGNENK